MPKGRTNMENKIKVFTAVLSLIAAVLSFPLLTEPKTDPSNFPPTLINLSSNASNPTYTGDFIKFQSRSKDDENDTLYYKFLINGPSTDNLWTTAQDWTDSNI
jgi:hypothetical protein